MRSAVGTGALAALLIPGELRAGEVVTCESQADGRLVAELEPP